MELKITKRLKEVANQVRHKRLADIGTDHAYLPIYLAKAKKIEYAVAGDVVEGPHKISLENVKENNLENVIKCRKKDGLEAIEKQDKIEVITICGMGGKLISDILEKGKEKLKKVECLILQPNVAEYLVREKVEELGYKIIEEKIIEESSHIYEIIVCIKGKMKLNAKQKKYGALLPQRKEKVFIKKYQKEIKKLDYILKELEKSEKTNKEKILSLQKEKNMIKEIIGEK